MVVAWLARMSRLFCDLVSQIDDLAPPEVLETIRCQFGIAHGVLNILVPQVGLKSPRIVRASTPSTPFLAGTRSGVLCFSGAYQSFEGDDPE
jgi:hypothetical protein